jgi:Domain of unknown function (DUF4403)
MRPLFFTLMLVGCGALTPLYPPRPDAVPGAALAEPEPARVVVHITVSSQALGHALDLAIPELGAGTFPLLGAQRRYVWKRQPMQVAFSQGRVKVTANVLATVEVGTLLELPMTLTIVGEPVISSDYHARLQSAEVQVTSDDPRLHAAQSVAGALDKIKDQIDAKLKEFSYDLQPLLGEAYARIAKPLDIPLGDAHGCAELRVLSVEAGPTVLADGIEKELAVVVAPAITLPCTAPSVPAPLPPLANVATIIPGPFKVVVPIAAKYDELAHAMGLAFTNGKLFFSKEFPELYMEKPEIYSAKDQLVLKLHINGPIHKFGINANLDGDLFMSGHPQVIDNELRIPDLEPTIETSNFLLRLKAALDGGSIRDQARDALHLDLGARLGSVRDKMSSELSFNNGQGCLRAAVNKIEVTGVHAHQNYLRLYVALTGQASVYLPCPTGPAPAISKN